MVSVCWGYLHCKRKQTAKSRDESKQPKWSRNILVVGVKLTFSQQQRSTLCGHTGKMNRWREAPCSHFLSGTHRRREAFPKVHARSAALRSSTRLPRKSLEILWKLSKGVGRNSAVLFCEVRNHSVWANHPSVSSRGFVEGSFYGRFCLQFSICCDNHY